MIIVFTCQFELELVVHGIAKKITFITIRRTKYAQFIWDDCSTRKSRYCVFWRRCRYDIWTVCWGIRRSHFRSFYQPLDEYCFCQLLIFHNHITKRTRRWILWRTKLLHLINCGFRRIAKDKVCNASSKNGCEGLKLFSQPFVAARCIFTCGCHWIPAPSHA